VAWRLSGRASVVLGTSSRVHGRKFKMTVKFVDMISSTYSTYNRKDTEKNIKLLVKLQVSWHQI
jgi:hypothetical protein